MSKCMTIPAVGSVESRGEARDLAIEWQHWQCDQALSWAEVADWNAFFNELAEKFDLTEEFKENGII